MSVFSACTYVCVCVCMYVHVCVPGANGDRRMMVLDPLKMQLQTVSSNHVVIRIKSRSLGKVASALTH